MPLSVTDVPANPTPPISMVSASAMLDSLTPMDNASSCHLHPHPAPPSPAMLPPTSTHNNKGVYPAPMDAPVALPATPAPNASPDSPSISPVNSASKSAETQRDSLCNVMTEIILTEMVAHLTAKSKSDTPASVDHPPAKIHAPKYCLKPSRSPPLDNPISTAKSSSTCKSTTCHSPLSNPPVTASTNATMSSMSPLSQEINQLTPLFPPTLLPPPSVSPSKSTSATNPLESSTHKSASITTLPKNTSAESTSRKL